MKRLCVDEKATYRNDMFKSKRKSVEEIWEGEQIHGVSDIVRFAPSACNSQPWLVKNNGELSVYRYRKPGKRGIMPADKVSFYNREFSSALWIFALSITVLDLRKHFIQMLVMMRRIGAECKVQTL